MFAHLYDSPPPATMNLDAGDQIKQAHAQKSNTLSIATTRTGGKTIPPVVPLGKNHSEVDAVFSVESDLVALEAPSSFVCLVSDSFLPGKAVEDRLRLSVT